MVDRTYSEQTVREAPEIEAYKLGLLESGKDLASTPLNLPRQQVASLSQLEQGAAGRAGQAGGIGGYRGLAQSGRGTLGTGIGTMGQAMGALGQAGSTLEGSYGQYYGGGPGYTAQGFDPSSVSSYMNPYEDKAVQQALSDIRREGTIAGNQQNAAAVQAGAFGGSRQGLQSAELGRNVLEQQARSAVGMRQSGYQNAMQQAQSDFADQQRRAQGQSQFVASQGQGAYENAMRRQQAAAQQQQGIASMYGNIGQAQANMGVQQLSAAQQAQMQGLQEMQAMQTLGGLQRQTNQAALNTDYQNKQRQMYEPMTRLSWLSDIYKGAPSSTSSIGSQVAPSAPAPSMFQQFGALGTGLLGATAAAKAGGLF